MVVPSMHNLSKVMAESGYTEEQVFDLGIEGEILFLVVVPLIGACRVPVDALSHFMAGADDYTADGMPEHYTGALSGPWKIKRDMLRILPESWEQYSDKAFELVDVQERADHSTEPLPIGFYRLRDAAEKIAKQLGWPDDATDTLISQWVNDAHDGSLTVRHPKTCIPCLPHTSGVYGEFLTAADVNAWAEKRGVLWRWSVEFAPEQTVATPAPAVTETVSGSLEPDKTKPLPLTTNEIANCFNGLRAWDVKRWKRELGSPDKWLKDCQNSKGTQGRGGYESTWWPVKIALALVNKDQKIARFLLPRFQRMEKLKPWLEELENNIPVNFEMS